MTVRCLIFLLLLPVVTFGQQRFYGTRVSSVTLTGALNDSDVQVIPLHSNDIITVENVRAAIQAIYDTGRYSFVEVDAEPSDGGTHLDFRVRPLYFFSTFRLEPDTLLNRSITGLFRLPYGERFYQTVVDRIAAEITEYLKNEGYFDATITSETQLDPATRLATVTFTASTVGKAIVQSVTITGGEETFNRKELLDAFGLQP